MIEEGLHPAETWVPAREDTLHYYLQARWYLENVGILQRNPAGAIRDLPSVRPSQRPRLASPAVFTNGRKGREYAAVYSHPDGLSPRQAEVWIDVNGDGRFTPDPAQGERFVMQAKGSDYRKGVLFTTTAPGDQNYVFRFADSNWNPPERGGLVPGKTQGISYAHWSDRP